MTALQKAQQKSKRGLKRKSHREDRHDMAYRLRAYLQGDIESVDNHMEQPHSLTRERIDYE